MATLPPSLIAGVDFDPGEEVLRHLDDLEPAAVVGDVLNMASVGGSEVVGDYVRLDRSEMRHPQQT